MWRLIQRENLSMVLKCSRPSRDHTDAGGSSVPVGFWTSSSSLGLVFLGCERQFSHHRRTNCWDTSSHGRHSVLHESHPHGGHRGHGWLGDLQTSAAHPGHPTHRCTHHTLGDIEEASGNPPHHVGRRHVVLTRNWGHRKMNGESR